MSDEVLFTLRDGTEALDPRLARLKEFDERSREFPIMASVSAKKPRSFTWRNDQYFDQGSEGACVGFSMTHELTARPAEVQHLSASFAREKIYWEAQKIDPWEGGAYPGATPQYEGTSVLAGVKMLKTLGYIDGYKWAFGLNDLVMAVGYAGPAVLGVPWYEGTSVLAGVKMLKTLGYIDGYKWAFGLNDLVMAVGYAGPAVLGVPWYEGMFNTSSCGHLHVTGQKAGGHAILCKGVNVKNKTFTLHNSWGSNWGDGGDALIHWDEMDRLLHEGGEAVIPTGRHKSSFLDSLKKLIGR